MDEAPGLKFREKFALTVQRGIGWLTFPLWGVFLIMIMRLVGRYRVLGRREIRRRYREIMKTTRGPVLICANHLTKIDSAIINWSLASVGSYMKAFRFFPWNLPERERYAGNPLLRMICYFGSCIPVDRGGDRDRVQGSLDKLLYLLHKGNAVTIFPEGKRSRSGRLETENFSYGVGRLFKAVRDGKVLCVYLRGKNQTAHSSIPKIGEQFYMDLKLFVPKTAFEGLRATRDISAQIIHQLKLMEQGYFAACR